MNWTNILKLAIALAITVGSHFVTPDPRVQMLGDTLGVALAQSNRSLSRKDDSASAPQTR